MFGGAPNPMFQPYQPMMQPPAAPPKPPKPQAVRPQPRPAPTVRAQNSDEPRKTLPLMPTPEQLGITTAKPASLMDLRVRLDRLGASGFQLVRQTDGWRFSCRLPNGRPVDAVGASETDAVLRALLQVESR